MGNEHLLVDVQDGVMKLTLNRPDSLNSLSNEMVAGILNATREASQNSDVRVVTIQGAGRAFCAGGDVKGMGEKNPLQTHYFIEKLNEAVLAIRHLEKPVIAIVHGYAAGAGFSLALACDLIVAEENSKFMMAFAQIGLIADGGSNYFLPRIVGDKRAKELLFSAEPIDAKKAESWGIVNHVYSADEFEEKSQAFVQKFVNGPGKSYEMTKKLVNQSFVSDLDEMLALEALTQTLMEQTNDFQEGIKAFKEKRKPVFKGN